MKKQVLFPPIRPTDASGRMDEMDVDRRSGQERRGRAAKAVQRPKSQKYRFRAFDDRRRPDDEAAADALPESIEIQPPQTGFCLGEAGRVSLSEMLDMAQATIGDSRPCDHTLKAENSLLKGLVQHLITELKGRPAP